MRAKLFSKQGVMKGKQFEFENEATVGRSEQNEIVINHKEVSKVHARIFLDPAKGCYYLEDLASANGTQLDGVKVHGKERLGHLHVITFSSAFDFIFLDIDLCKNRHPSQATSPGEPVAEIIPEKMSQEPITEKPQVEEQHFHLPPTPPVKQDPPKKIVDETIVEQKPFILPHGLGKGEVVTPTVPADTEDKTMMEEKPFVLPQGLEKVKKEKDGNK